MTSVFSPLGFGRRALSSRYDSAWRPPRRSSDEKSGQKIRSLQGGHLGDIAARNITPPTLGIRQGPYMSELKQSSYDYKIGSNKWLQVMGRLVKRFIGENKYKDLVNIGNQIARRLGMQPVDSKYLQDRKLPAFPPMIMARTKDNRVAVVHITFQLPVFVQALFQVTYVTNLFRQVEEKVSEFTQANRENLDWMTLSLAHKRRSAQSKSNRDKFKYVYIDQNGDLGYLEEKDLKDLSQLMNYDILGVVSKRPSSLGLVDAQARINDRTGWVNPQASAEQRRGDSKMADLNAQVSFLKSKLIKNAETIFKACTDAGRCTPKHYSDAFTLENPAQLLWEFKKRNRLARLNSKLRSAQFTFGRFKTPRLQQIIQNLQKQIHAVKNSTRRRGKGIQKEQQGPDVKEEEEEEEEEEEAGGEEEEEFEAAGGEEEEEDEPLVGEDVV